MPEPTAADQPTYPESDDLLRARAVPFDAAFTIGALGQFDALLAPDVVYARSTGQRQARSRR
jgi:hypothetical protein